ncbi:helix-turn-helix transcriptional regulator [Actinoplanes sp. NPDC024001]|uniref:helix-turn-helix transcriptional regulator n=1 Tax=Actinoplanes sp. NPDC024001 TaxID=3154598 RepID=UPI0033E5809F
MDPGNVETAAELAAALDRLVRGRGLSLRDLAKEARKRQAALPPSTVSDVLRGRTVPAPQTLGTLLSVLGVAAAELPRWLAARERAAGSGGVRAPGAVRVHTTRGRLLGVHAAIAGGAGLPAYVSRDLDERLRAAVAAPGLVVLVGGSSVGKTRSAHEAVRATLPQWWLVHPAGAAAVHALAADPPPRTVIWLDELQHYLDGPEPLRAAPVRALIEAGAVLVGTLWPDEYTIRTTPRTPHQPDPYAQDRRLLDLAQVIDVPDAFSDAELGRAEALAGDRRIRIALDTPDAGFTQVLAAGPELVRRWEQAPQCYGRAVLTAAIDARRVGCHAPLTRELLEAAAPGYLHGPEQAAAPADWLDQALGYATAPLHGATSALVPTPAGMGQTAGWTVADYLFQHARRVRRTAPLPDVVWQALVALHHPSDTARLADNAARRGRWAEASALGGPKPAAHRLAILMGGQVCAEEMRERAGTDDQAYQQAARLAAVADLGELRRLANAGDHAAGNWLVRVLIRQDRAEEAMGLLRKAADAGSTPAARRLAEMLAADGRITEAAAVLRERADAGSVGAAHQLVGLLSRHGRFDELTAEMAAGTAGAAVTLRSAAVLVPRG